MNTKPGRMRCFVTTATAILTIAGVAMAGMGGTAQASWDFEHDQRTCYTGYHKGIKILTNEDECAWPR